MTKLLTEGFTRVRPSRSKAAIAAREAAMQAPIPAEVLVEAERIEQEARTLTSSSRLITVGAMLAATMSPRHEAPADVDLTTGMAIETPEQMNARNLRENQRHPGNLQARARRRAQRRNKIAGKRGRR